VKLTKSKLKEIIKEELLKERGEKSEEELACERKAADRGVPMGFNPSTGKCEMLNEDIGIENLWEELEDLIAYIANHSSDHEAVDKADRAMEVFEEIRNTYKRNK